MRKLRSCFYRERRARGKKCGSYRVAFIESGGQAGKMRKLPSAFNRERRASGKNAEVTECFYRERRASGKNAEVTECFYRERRTESKREKMRKLPSAFIESGNGERRTENGERRTALSNFSILVTSFLVAGHLRWRPPAAACD